jgi:hypothetical protein
MNAGQLERLRRARDLLVVKGYDTGADETHLLQRGRASTLSWAIEPQVIR